MDSGTKFDRIVGDMAIEDADIVRDRKGAIDAVVHRVKERIRVELGLEHESSWEFADGTHSDVVFHFNPISGPQSKAVASPKQMSERAHHIWENALNRWPKVLRGSAFLDLVMQSSTEGMSPDTFAEVFQRVVKGGN